MSTLQKPRNKSLLYLESVAPLIVPEMSHICDFVITIIRIGSNKLKVCVWQVEEDVPQAESKAAPLAIRLDQRKLCQMKKCLAFH